jgi:predicted nucleic acid-binding protein
MKILNRTFLIDYLDGDDSTRKYLQKHDSGAYLLPIPAYAEGLLGKEKDLDGDTEDVREDLSWGEVHAVDKWIAVTAAEIAADMGPQGPFSTGWTR